jgi:cysteine desulfurase/selenocysteine lyase
LATAVNTRGTGETLGVERIRADFPILSREVNGKPLVYLDNGATSQKPAAVIEAIDRYYRTSNANIHRSMHQLASEATEIYEGARSKVASFLGAATPEEIVFVRNATEAINLVRYSWGRKNVDAGDVVVISEMEHHSNIVPWQLLCQERGATLEYVPITGDGQLYLEVLWSLLAGGRVRLVALTHVSNVLGTINPVSEIAARCHEAEALLLLDGAQGAPQLPLDVAALGADFYAITARAEVLERMPPFLGGGSMIDKVEEKVSTWAPIPAKFEAGTPAIAEAAGLAAAIDYLNEIGMERVREHERGLIEYALERLGGVSKLRVHGPRDPEQRAGLISFEVDGMHPHDISELLNREGVAIRAGHHCAQPLMRRLGVPATARASFAVYNTRAEIDRLVAALESAKSVFGI